MEKMSALKKKKSRRGKDGEGKRRKGVPTKGRRKEKKGRQWVEAGSGEREHEGGKGKAGEREKGGRGVQE